DGEPDGDPRLDETRSVDRSGQAHHQPARHVRRTGAQRGDPGRQLPAREHVVVEIVSASERVPADAQHGGEIDAERYVLEGLITHLPNLRGSEPTALPGTLPQDQPN